MIFRFRTPTGTLALKAFSPEDVVTLFIVFCRKEYTPLASARKFVDFGSNIGITAAFFLSRSENNIVFCFEPNKVSTQRLKENLMPFEGRYFLEEICVGIENGMVEFGVEETGVYSGIGLKREDVKAIQVTCRDANDVLLEIAARHPTIDFLKIDIEGLEKDVIRRMTPEILNNVRQIEAETGDFDHQIAGFAKTRHGAIVKYRRLD